MITLWKVCLTGYRIALEEAGRTLFPESVAFTDVCSSQPDEMRSSRLYKDGAA